MSEPVTPFRQLHHLCVAVEDIDAAMQFYVSAGIGPWHPYPPLTDFTQLDGCSAEGFRSLTYRWTMVGDLQLQLVQPGSGMTPQRDFLHEHGSGLYHVGFVVEDADAAEEAAVGLGLRPTQRGRRPDGSGFTYYDTRSRAGVTLETRQSPARSAAASSRTSSMVAGPFEAVQDVVLAVPDLASAVEFYAALGIGPWQDARLDHVVGLAGSTPRRHHEVAAARAPVGAFGLRLLGPVTDQTVAGQMVRESSGAGFGLSFVTRPLSPASDVTARLGLVALVCGNYADGSPFSWYHTRPSAGLTFELQGVRSPTDGA